MPPCENHAHHIVAGGDVRANKARGKLEKFWIDINDKENGTFLPGSAKDKEVFKGNDIDKYGDILPHAEIHTNVYYDEIETMLLEATDKETAIAILGDIETQIWSGLFPK